MTYSYNPNTIRSRRAKYANILNRHWLVLSIRLSLVLFLTLSIFLLFSGGVIGYLPLAISALLLTLNEWQRGDLANLNYGKGVNGDNLRVEELLEPSFLANLSAANPSIQDVWLALKGSEERYFFGNRYLLSDSFFEQFVDKTPGSAAKIWPVADQLRQKYGVDYISNASVFTAIVLEITDIDQILRRIELDPVDIENSVPWLRDVNDKRALVRARRNFGGIGRDWAFGYTPILGSLGYNISAEIQQYGFFMDTQLHTQVVQQMAQTMGSGGSTVTLVGDDGVGKTTCVHAFAEKLLEDGSLPDSIRYHQVVQLDAPSLIANTKNPGELEELMIRLINEARKAKNIILFFDDAEVFFGSDQGGLDLTHVLLPVLESSSLRVVMAVRPSAWQQLSKSGVASKLKQINVPPSDQTNTLAVLRDAIASVEHQHHVIYTYQALNESYKLGVRYETNLAMPGAALSILEQAATATQQQLITKEIVQQSVEQTYGIKLQKAEGDESAKLLDLETELHKYVINQNRAVTVVADALRRSRSGVGNPNRPVGTFLFLGPTGVGKTELSKALARTYFGDEQALIRIDMNQYVGADDVSRLIQPMVGGELGFLGSVRKKPFSVILLDEIEKAHSSVVNSLLQMLDEGEMRDSDNKPVSFKDAIIIATSNAGADEIRRLIDEGQDIAKAEAAFVETLIQRGLFAPELVNRFDEVVIFTPLEKDELIQVIDLIIAEVNKTLDTQKVHVELTQPAKQWLVDKGYDSKLGARPMRRVAQRYVENIIAKKLLDKSLQSGGTIQLDVPDFEAMDS